SSNCLQWTEQKPLNVSPVTRVGHLDDAYMSNGKPVGITLYQLPRSKYEELINVST
ncbi:DUF2824 family protein, partial [Escherichia coli]|uniref:DUF2824 family protein n=1 Tax=Escherichia coli TaxID=562 RepID=UPI000E1D30AB